jgi:hypothetical protein
MISAEEHMQSVLQQRGGAVSRAECLQWGSAWHQRYLTHTPEPYHHLWYPWTSGGMLIDSL